MFCRKCGAEIRLNAKFCAKCGAPAPAAKAPEVKAPERKVEEKAEKVIYVPPTPAPEPMKPTVAPTVKPAAPEVAADGGDELIIKMSGMKDSSSNGQFNDWFSDPGDL